MKPKKCQWCSGEFHSSHHSKMFCTAKCKNDFGNWITVVGKRLAPIALAWRASRGRAGVGSEAMKEMVRLLDKANADLVERGAQPISHHFRKVRAAGTGITLKSDR